MDTTTMTIMMPTMRPMLLELGCDGAAVLALVTPCVLAMGEFSATTTLDAKEWSVSKDKTNRESCSVVLSMPVLSSETKNCREYVLCFFWQPE
jgi:hypothetical protein